LQKAFFPLTEQVTKVTNWISALNSSIDKTISSIDAQTRSWIGFGLSIAGLISSVVLGKKVLDTFFSLFSSKSGNLITRAFSGIGKGIGSVSSGLLRVGGMLLRFLGPLAMLYAAFQAGSAIGEVLYETLSQMGGFNDLMDTIFSSIEAAGKWIMDGIDFLGEKVADAAEWIFEKLTDAGKFILSGFSLISDYIKEAGQFILNLFPWLKTVGDYISGVVGVFKTVMDHVSMFADALKGVIFDILKRFGNKMTFGLFEDSPASASTTSATAPQASNQPAAPAMSIPKAPAASTIESPSAVPAEAPVPGKSTDKSTATATAATSNGIDRQGKKDDINSLLVNQGLLLEQILTGTNQLVSVNKDILKYARNSA
jgi:hypothetical protein